MIDRDRVHWTTIDETGRQVSGSFGDKWAEAAPLDEAIETVYSHGMAMWNAQYPIKVECMARVMSDGDPPRSILAAANAANYYGADAVRFAKECDKATEFLISMVAAAGGDRRRFRDRRSRKRLTLECLNRADVPAQYLPGFWNTLWNGAKTIVGIAVPPPWNVVIAAVLWAVERYLGGEV